jgi:hypothetical protein
MGVIGSPSDKFSLLPGACDGWHSQGGEDAQSDNGGNYLQEGETAASKSSAGVVHIDLRLYPEFQEQYLYLVCTQFKLVSMTTHLIAYIKLASKDFQLIASSDGEMTPGGKTIFLSRNRKDSQK